MTLFITQVDVIICCTGPKLDLSQGKITQALVNVGGTALQADCNKNYPSGIQNEDIADIGPGNLPCKRVYLGVLPKYGTDKQTAEQVYIIDLSYYHYLQGAGIT